MNILVYIGISYAVSLLDFVKFVISHLQKRQKVERGNIVITMQKNIRWVIQKPIRCV